jgi:hypothetical protein
MIRYNISGVCWTYFKVERDFFKELFKKYPRDFEKIKNISNGMSFSTTLDMLNRSNSICSPIFMEEGRNFYKNFDVFSTPSRCSICWEMHVGGYFNFKNGEAKKICKKCSKERKDVV